MVLSLLIHFKKYDNDQSIYFFLLVEREGEVATRNLVFYEKRY